MSGTLAQLQSVGFEKNVLLSSKSIEIAFVLGQIFHTRNDILAVKLDTRPPAAQQFSGDKCCSRTPEGVEHRRARIACQGHKSVEQLE